MTRFQRTAGTVVIALLTSSLLSAAQSDRAGRMRGAPGRPGVGQGAGPQWNEAELVFTGTLSRVDAGPVGQSYPPMYTHTLHVRVESVLRGPLRPGSDVACSHVARQHQKPSFPVGQVCLIAASKGHCGDV